MILPSIFLILPFLCTFAQRIFSLHNSLNSFRMSPLFLFDLAALTANLPENTGLGVGLGTILAIVLSWSRNSSIFWAIVHAFCGWFYVIYYAFTR